MQGEQLKKVSVKLGTCIPLGRKFLVIREGKQLLMLKARGGSRSVYSIEEQAVIGTGSTRSGKKHFRYSFHKFVNGLEGMNNQKGKGDHVTVTKTSSSGGVSQRPKNFAKKSTGNNIKRTLQQARTSSERPTHQLLNRDSRSSRSRSRSQSPANIHQKSSSQKPEVKGQVKGKEVRREKPDAKNGQRTDKPTSSASSAQREGQGSSYRVVSSKRYDMHNGEGIDKQKNLVSAAKAVGAKNGHINNKDNHPKGTTQLEETAKQPVEDRTGSLTNPTVGNHGITKDTGVPVEDVQTPVKPAAHSPAQTSESKDTSSTDEKNKEAHPPSKSLPAVPHRQRASTPTPESPVKKSAVNRLSRKRHRSASPKVSPATEKQTGNLSAAQGVKVNRDAIRLDSTKFGKVKKLCRDAISLRKDSLVQKGSPETVKGKSDMRKPTASTSSKDNVSTKKNDSPRGGFSENMEKEAANTLVEGGTSTRRNSLDQKRLSQESESGSDMCKPSAGLKKDKIVQGGSESRKLGSDLGKSTVETTIGDDVSVKRNKTVESGSSENSENRPEPPDQGKPTVNTIQKESQGSSITKRRLLSSSSTSTERLSPAPKKQKLSSKKGDQHNSSPTSRSSDSEDGLTKLMKKFQSAMSSSSQQGCSNTSREIPKECAVKSPRGSTQKTVEKSVQKSPNTSDSSTSHQLRELDALQTEEVSSDEDFEASQEESKGRSLQNATPAKSDAEEQKKDTMQIDEGKEKLTTNVDKFLVVDEVGYTPSKIDFPPAEPSLSRTNTKLSKAIDGLFLAKAPKDKDEKEDDKKRGKLGEGKEIAEKVEKKPELGKVHGNSEASKEEIKCQLNQELKKGRPIIGNSNKGTVLETEKLEVEQHQKDAAKLEGQELKVKKLSHDTVSSTVLQTDIALKFDDTKVSVLASGKLKDEELKPDASVEKDEKGAKLDSPDLGVEKASPPDVSSTAVQTELACQERSSQTDTSKPKVQHQGMQFNGEPTEIDPVEITRIVSAMVESECEERERLKNALQESTQKEEKWRSLVQDLCRQLRELRQQLEKKEDKIKMDKWTITDNGVSRLPCIISSQASQTEYGKETGTVLRVSNDASKHAKATPRETVSASATNTASPVRELGPQNTQLVTKSVHSGDLGKAAAGNSASDKVTDQTVLKKVSDEVIDLTDAEEISAEKKRQPPMAVLVGALQNPTVLSSKAASTAKLMSGATTTTNMRPAQLKPHFLSSVQGVPKTAQSKVSQNAATPVTSFNRMPIMANGQIVVSQPSATAPPPPLQPAPNVNIATLKAQGNQLPMLTQIGGNRLLLQNQPSQPRQNIVLTQQVMQPQQVIGIQRFTAQPQQQQQVQNAVLLEGVKSAQQQQQVQNAVLIEGMKRGLIAPYQGNIIIPGTSQQSQQQRMRVPQNQIIQQVPVQTQKAMLEKKKEQTAKQMQQAFQQRNTKQGLALNNQLQAIVNQISRLNNQQVQQANPSTIAASNGTRYSQPAATYTSSPASRTQVGQASHPQPVQQMRNVAQRKDIPTNLPVGNARIVNGTWHPRPPAVNTKQPMQPNTRSPSYKHPAALPILQAFSNLARNDALLPPPSICISHSSEGVVLSWNINVTQDHPSVEKYFLYAYQVLDIKPNTNHWKRIGEVGALPPPMACTLNQFQPGSTYFLAICAVDVYDRPGKFSKTEEVVIPL